MKLELLTNATVVDDAIRFVSSHTVATAIERDNAGYGVTLDKDEESDVQRSKKSHSQRSTRETTTTTNTVF